MKHMLGAGFVCVFLAGCGGGGADEASSTTATTTLPSATTTVPVTTTTVPSTTTTVLVTTTTVPVTTTTVSAEQRARADAVGDVAVGEELFFTPMDGINHDWSCSSCHTLDGTTAGRHPSLLGISTVAGERVEGMSDVDYLRQSLTDPLVFRAGDWTASMPYQYAEVLSEDQVNDLVAFLMTR